MAQTNKQYDLDALNEVEPPKVQYDLDALEPAAARPAPTPTPEAPDLTWGDYGKAAIGSALKGSMEVVKTPLSAISAIGGLVNNDFPNTTLGRWARAGTEHITESQQMADKIFHTPEFAQAIASNPIHDPTTGEWRLPNMAQITDTGVTGLVMAPAFMLGGQGIAKGAAMIPKVTETAATLMGYGATSGAFGAITTFEEATTEARKALAAEDMTEEEKNVAANMVASTAAIRQIPISTALGVFGFGKAATSTGPVLRRMASEGFRGAWTAGVEGTATGVNINTALQEVDPDRKWHEGALERGIMGTVTGGVLSTTIAGVQGKPARPHIDQIDNATNVDDVISAAQGRSAPTGTQVGPSADADFGGTPPPRLEMPEVRLPQAEQRVVDYTPEQQQVMDTYFEKPKEGVAKFVANVQEGAERVLTEQYWVDKNIAILKVLGDKKAYMQANQTAAAAGILETVTGFRMTNQSGERVIAGGKPVWTEDGAVSSDSSVAPWATVMGQLKGNNLEKWFAWKIGNRLDTLGQKDKQFSVEAKEVLKGMGRGNEELFRAVDEQFKDLHYSIVDFAQKAGTISRDAADFYKEDGTWINFTRVLDDTDTRKGPGFISSPSLARQKGLKQFKGGTQKINRNFEQTLVQNWDSMIQSAVKNNASRAVIDTAVNTTLADGAPVARSITADEAKNNANATYVLRDGKQHWYEFANTREAKAVLWSLEAMNTPVAGKGVVNGFRIMKKAVTFAHSVDPTFRGAMAALDTVIATAVTPAKRNVFQNLKDGYKALHDPDTAAKLLASGGVFGHSGYIDGADQHVINKLVREGHPLEGILNDESSLRRMWNKYEETGKLLENINRAAVSVQREGEVGLLQASFEGRDILDHTRHGAGGLARFSMVSTPFWNSIMQGINKTKRAVADPALRKSVRNFTIAYGALSLINHASMLDDEDYKKLQPWERTAYHHVRFPWQSKDEPLSKVKRVFELGAFVSLVESSFDWTLAQLNLIDPIYGEQFKEKVYAGLGGMLPIAPVPPAGKLIVEKARNTNLYTGAPINPEARGTEGLEKSEIMKRDTGPTARAVSTVAPILTPAEVEHVVKVYFSFVGKAALAASDGAISLFSNEPEKPKGTGNTFSGLLGIRENLKQPGIYGDIFYNRLKEIEAVEYRIGQARRQQDPDKVVALTDQYRPIISMKAKYNNAQQRISRINKRVDALYASRIDGAAKLEELKRLNTEKSMALIDLYNDTPKGIFESGLSGKPNYEAPEPTQKQYDLDKLDADAIKYDLDNL